MVIHQGGQNKRENGREDDMMMVSYALKQEEKNIEAYL